MSEVRFVDSTGVGLLLRLQKSLHGRGRHLALLGPGTEVLRVLSLMRLKDFFLTAPDILSAEEAIRQRAEEDARRPGPLSDGILRWPGEVTAANADQVWAKTAAHFSSESAAQPWAIDLSGVRFIDSSGLGLMIRARKLARQRGTVLLLKSPGTTVQNVIRLAGLEKHLTDPSQASAA
jgi:anti-anti-sigma factor